MKGGLLLNVVVRESAALLELLAGEDQALLIRRDALLVLDFLKRKSSQNAPGKELRTRKKEDGMRQP